MSAYEDPEKKAGQGSDSAESSSVTASQAPADVFADDENHEIRYKTLSWQVRTHTIYRSFCSRWTCADRLFVYDCGDRQQWHAVSP